MHRVIPDLLKYRVEMHSAQDILENMIVVGMIPDI